MSKAVDVDFSNEVSENSNPAESLYKPPALKSVQEILQIDAEDESLRRYKESLLGKNSLNVVVDHKDPRVVILMNVSLLSDGRPDVVLDIADMNKLSDMTFKIKEGVVYRLRFRFHVQREMVTGLRYSHKVSKMGISVINENFMVGSYAPRAEIIDYVTPPEEAPSGMLSRGKYKVSSKLSDDYANEYAKWQWTLEIAKDW